MFRTPARDDRFLATYKNASPEIIIIFLRLFSCGPRTSSEASCRSIVYEDDIFFITPFYIFLLRHVLITSRGTMINETTKHSTTKTTSLTNISPAAIILVLLLMIIETTVFNNIILSLHTVSSKLQLFNVFTQNNNNIRLSTSCAQSNIYEFFFLHTIVLCRLVYSEFLKNCH